MEAKPNESTPPLSDDANEEVQQQLDGYAAEYRDRIDDIVDDMSLGDNLEQSLEGVYRSLTSMSVQCMDLYIKLRWVEDMLRDENR